MAALIGLAPALAYGQPTEVAPTNGPQHPLLEFRSSTPHQAQSGAVSILLSVRSLTGAPVEVVAPFGHQGWSAYSASGEACTTAAMITDSLPYWTGTAILNGTAIAGVNGPLLVPLQLNPYSCHFHRGDEISYNVVFLVVQGRELVPQNFSVQQKIVQ